MTPQQAIAALDRMLAAHGEDAVLFRPVLGPNNAQSLIKVGVRVQTAGYQPKDLIQGSGILQGDVRVIMSPTQINRVQWPGGAPAVAGAVDPRIPTKNDRIIVGGHALTVQGQAAVRRINGEIVRFEMQARG